MMIENLNEAREIKELSRTMEAIETIGAENLSKHEWSNIVYEKPIDVDFVDKYNTYFDELTWSMIGYKTSIKNDHIICKYIKEVLASTSILNICDENIHKEIIFNNLDDISLYKLIKYYNDTETLSNDEREILKLNIKLKIISFKDNFCYPATVKNIFTFSELCEMLTFDGSGNSLLMELIKYGYVKGEHILTKDDYDLIINSPIFSNEPHIEVIESLVESYYIGADLLEYFTNDLFYITVKTASLLLDKYTLDDDTATSLYIILDDDNSIIGNATYPNIFTNRDRKFIDNIIDITSDDCLWKLIDSGHIDFNIISEYTYRFNRTDWRKLVSTYELSEKFIDTHIDKLFITCKDLFKTHQLLTKDQIEKLNLEEYNIGLVRGYGEGNEVLRISNKTPDHIYISELPYVINDDVEMLCDIFDISDEDKAKIDKCIAMSKERR